MKKLTCKKCNEPLEEQCCVVTSGFECQNGCLDDMNPHRLIKLGYTYFEVKRLRGEYNESNRNPKGLCHMRCM